MHAISGGEKVPDGHFLPWAGRLPSLIKCAVEVGGRRLMRLPKNRLVLDILDYLYDRRNCIDYKNPGHNMALSCPVRRERAIFSNHHGGVIICSQ